MVQSTVEPPVILVSPPLTSAKVLDTFLSSNRLLGTLSSAGIGPRPLTPHGQASPVSQPAVAADVTQTGHVLGGLPPQWPFDDVVPFHQRCQTTQLVIGQLASLPLRIDPRLVAQVARGPGPPCRRDDRA